jgi:hypothetical protein
MLRPGASTLRHLGKTAFPKAVSCNERTDSLMNFIVIQYVALPAGQEKKVVPDSQSEAS